MALLTKDRQAQSEAGTPIHHSPALRSPEIEALEAHGKEEDRSYGRAVMRGVGLGIVVWTAIVFGVLRLLQPDLGAGPTLGIAVWVGIWTGMFLGGTITVGLWADKRH